MSSWPLSYLRSGKQPICIAMITEILNSALTAGPLAVLETFTALVRVRKR
jgi:hypothetical protein